MGTTASRLDSTRRKHRRKLPSLKSQRSTRDMLKNNDDIASPVSSNPTSTYPPTPVNLVKHQVVLSDHVPPMSTLSAVIAIPIRRSSWRKSTNTTATKTTADNASIASLSCFDDNDEAISSPRTSVASEENPNNAFLKVENNTTEKKKSHKKKTSSFSSFRSSHKKEGSDIVFESKYNSSPSLSVKTEEKSPSLLDHPRPFWTFNNGDEKEYDRQLRQHYVLKHVLDGNIHVPVSTDQPTTVLDAACGAGFWTLDMAQSYPNAKIIGLDAFPADDKRMKGYSDAATSATNIVYKYGDLTTHLSLPDNYLDVIYQRDTASIIPHERWSFILGELFRVAKPGGYLELVEYSFNIKDPGPVLALVNEWYKIASTSVGVDPRQAKHLRSAILSAGFEDVEKRVISIPIGEWPTDENQRENGFLYKQVIKALFKSMKPWWLSELAVSEKEYDKVVSAAMDEFNDQCCSMDWVIYTARKPLNQPGSNETAITPELTANELETLPFA